MKYYKKQVVFINTVSFNINFAQIINLSSIIKILLDEDSE